MTGEEYGGNVTFTIQTGGVATVSMFLRQWDSDGVAAAHLDTETGGTTSRKLAHSDVSTDDKRPGSTASGVVLYLSPRADQHPGLLLFHAVPTSFGDPVTFGVANPFEVPVVYYCAPADVSGTARVWSMGLRDDLHSSFGSWLSS